MCIYNAGIVLWVSMGIMGLYSYLLECSLLILSLNKTLVDLTLKETRVSFATKGLFFKTVFCSQKQGE